MPAVKIVAGPPSEDWSYEQAFARNQGLVSSAEQDILRQSTVGIPGLGGVGGVHLMTLARMGLGGFHILDRDEFSVSNFNRQYGATTGSIGKSKAEVMRDLALSVNPDLRLVCEHKFLGRDNVDEFVTSVDIVVDSLDAFAIDERLMLFEACYKHGVPIVTAGPIGFSTAMLIQIPGGRRLTDYLAIDDSMTLPQKFVRFIVGLTPRPYFLKYMQTSKIDFADRCGPSVACSVNLCAGFAAVEVLKILLDKGCVRPLPYFHYYDGLLQKFIVRRVWGGNRNPLQRLKIWYIGKYHIKEDGA